MMTLRPSSRINFHFLVDIPCESFDGHVTEFPVAVNDPREIRKEHVKYSKYVILSMT